MSNFDDDYDNDGNNIVPCPICGDVRCPSNEDRKCPEEDAFVRGVELSEIFKAKLTEEEIKKATGIIAMMINEAGDKMLKKAISTVEWCPTIKGMDRHRKIADTGVFRKTDVIASLKKL